VECPRRVSHIRVRLSDRSVSERIQAVLSYPAFIASTRMKPGAGLHESRHAATIRLCPDSPHSIMTFSSMQHQRVSCKKKWKWMKWPAAGGVLLAVASAGTGAGAGAWPLLAALFAACRPPGRSDDAGTPPGREATPGCSRGRIGKARGEREVRHCVLAGGVRSQHTSTSTGCKRVADLRSPKCKLQSKCSRSALSLASKLDSTRVL
jgi:hypothetical protein